MGFPELHSKVGRTGDNCFIRIAENNVIHPVRVGLDLIAKGGWRRSRQRIELAICPPLCNVDTKIPWTYYAIPARRVPTYLLPRLSALLYMRFLYDDMQHDISFRLTEFLSSPQLGCSHLNDGHQGNSLVAGLYMEYFLSANVSRLSLSSFELQHRNLFFVGPFSPSVKHS